MKKRKMSNKKTGGYILAGVVGALVGAVGGLLFAPKSGKETREEIMKMAKELSKSMKTGVEDTKGRVKEVFGEASKAALDKYSEIRSSVVNKVVAVKAAGQEVDKEKYGKIVEDVVAEFKGDLSATKNGASKLASQLKKDWEKVKEALA